MPDRPILFSAPMVRALLAGTKTQTRRVAKITTLMGEKVAITVPEESLIELELGEFRKGIVHYLSTGALSGPYRLPHKVGDRLWVREAWRTAAALDFVPPRLILAPIHYEADGPPTAAGDCLSASSGKLRASMHMPRWASRLTLLVTDVRVQRLQDVSEEDARAEGIHPFRDTGSYISPKHPDGEWRAGDNAYAMYRDLWNAINGAGAWGDNPWVAAYTFTVHQQNIDAMDRPTPALSEHDEGGAR